MIFNGAPSFVANMKKDSAFGQILQFKNDGKMIKIIATGTPANTGPWVEVASNFEAATPSEGRDMGGRAYQQRSWYSEETEEFHTQLFFTVEGNELSQLRTLVNGKLYLRVEMKKPDGRMEFFEATFRKV